MNYLKYIEHAAENLQFFLWFRDYSARFNDLADGERALSPEWTREQVEAEATSAAQQTRTKHANVEASAILKDTSFDDGNSTQANERGDPFHTPPSASFDESRGGVTSEYGSSISGYDTLVTSAKARGIAGQAFGDAGMKWQPCTPPLLLSYCIPIPMFGTDIHADDRSQSPLNPTATRSPASSPSTSPTTHRAN
jgi:hypothetical protein